MIEKRISTNNLTSITGLIRKGRYKWKECMSSLKKKTSYYNFNSSTFFIIIFYVYNPLYTYWLIFLEKKQMFENKRNTYFIYFLSFSLHIKLFFNIQYSVKYTMGTYLANKWLCLLSTTPFKNEVSSVSLVLCHHPFLRPAWSLLWFSFSF